MCIKIRMIRLTTFSGEVFICHLKYAQWNIFILFREAPKESYLHAKAPTSASKWDQLGPERTNMDQLGLEGTSMDQFGLEGTSMEQSGLIWTNWD